ncbi:MAG: zinc-binding dehydrogenase [Actinomycetaceae bacterium]|nr:zinc-binding dehydrogenase [Actinomycetaceae bacterium]
MISDAAYDIVVDPVGGKATEHGFRVLRAGGRLVRVGNASQADDVPVSSIAHWLQNKTTAGFNVGAWLAANPEAGTESLAWVLEAAGRGDIHVELSATAGPERAAELLAALEKGETTGKLAIRMR